jgi:hypothetical protein
LYLAVVPVTCSFRLLLAAATDWLTAVAAINIVFLSFILSLCFVFLFLVFYVWGFWIDFEIFLFFCPLYV